MSSGTDCNDADSDSWTLPGEVSGLFVQSDKESFSWSEPAEPGGVPGTLEFGLLRADRPDDFTQAVTCIPAANSTTITDSEIPLSSEAFFYLSRAVNGCGQGTLGAGSGGTERIGSTCP